MDRKEKQSSGKQENTGALPGEMAYSAEELQGALEPYAEEELKEAGEPEGKPDMEKHDSAEEIRKDRVAASDESEAMPETGEEAPEAPVKRDCREAGEEVSEEPPEQSTKAKKTEAETKPSASGEVSGEKGKKKKRGFGWIIPVILAAVFVVSFASFLKQFLIYQQAKNEYQLLDQYMEDASQDTDAGAGQEASVEMADGGEEAQEAAPSVEYPHLQIDFDALQKTNPEFNSIIYLPVLDLKYPVVQADNNDKYLNTTFEGTRNASGCIFLDTVASPDFSDWNTFVFGHNMKNQTMFGSLKKFLQEEDLCDQNPYIYIYQKDQVLVYRIFAYYTIPVRDDVYDDFFDEKGYDSYVADAKKHSLYQPGEDEIDWESRPKLLTLSTCYATGHVSNFIVQGALIGTAQTVS